MPAHARVTAHCGDAPAVVELPHGKGAVTMSLTPYGLNSESVLPDGEIENGTDMQLPCPFRLLDHVRLELEKLFAGQRLFSVGDELGYITCRKGPGSSGQSRGHRPGGSKGNT